MPEIEIPDRFRIFAAQLPPEIRRKLANAIRMLANDPRYPSLQSKPVEGAPGIYEARVDLQYRLTCERLPGDVLRLRVVGKHDDVLKNP